MARKKKPVESQEILSDVSSVVADSPADSPVENLPHVEGKRRRGRPRKSRTAAGVSPETPEAAGDGMPPRPASGGHTQHMTRGQIHGAVRQMVEKQLQSADKRRLGVEARAAVKANTPVVADPGIAAEVQAAITDDRQQQAEEQAIGSGRGGRWRHLLI